MKFYPPLGSTTHWITQTNHGESASNPDDLSKQNAIDLSAVAGHPIYAVHDGTIVNATSSYGGYCTLDIGEAFYVLYVHTAKWLPTGTKVRRGQKIAEVKSMTGSHLHLGLKNKTGKAPHPDPMGYMDRVTKYDSKYAIIKKMWFKNGAINWALFPDSHLKGTDCEQRVKEAVESNTRTWQAKLLEEQKKHAATQKLLVEKNGEVKELEVELAGVKQDLQLCMERNEKLEQDIKDYANIFRQQNERIQALEEKNSQLVGENQELAEKLADCQGGDQPSGCAVPLGYLVNKLSTIFNGSTLSLNLEEEGEKGTKNGGADKLPA